MVEIDADYKKFESLLLKEIKEMYDREIRNEVRSGISIHLTIKIRNKKFIGIETLKNKSLQQSN